MKKTLVYLATLVLKNIFWLLGVILPKKQNVIVFESFFGKQYSDNPRAIYEYLLERNSEYEMYWSFDKKYITKYKDKDIKYVKRFSLKWLFVMTRAKFWVNNCRLPSWIPKPKNTNYVQTWHGTPLKKLATDIEEVYMAGTETSKYKREFLKEAQKWDYLISPNEYSTKIFSNAFSYKKEIIETGYPRNDFLLNCNNKETRSEIKRKLILPKDKKVILYAPTWRDNQFYTQGKYKFALQLDLHRMREELEGEYVILLRLHYLIAEHINLTDFQGFVFDVSNYEDIRELYLVSDILITDYSSVFFDYANLKRPILFFVYDIEEYRDNLRGFYFDFENKAPGPLLKSNDEILNEIVKIEKNGFIPSRKYLDFYKKFCYLEDGKASERVVKEVFEK